MMVFSGNANRGLAGRICEHLGIPVGNISCSRFPDGECDVKIDEDIRGADLFLVQSTCPPVNDHLMELLAMIDCARRASADRITAVIPYFGYARQDRKAEGRVPITAKLVANLLCAAGANRILTMDLHAAQIQGFFDIPVDHLFASPVLVDHFRKKELGQLSLLSPDVGSIKMCRAYAKRLNAGLAICDKRRSGSQETEVMHVIGDIKGKNVIIADDLISTAASITEAARTAWDRGARDVFMTATHPVLCGPAMDRLVKARVHECVVTDTIPLGEKRLETLHVLSVAGLFAEAIKRIHKSESVSSLFL
ncbi:MAG: ribose-phosphate pyrophosphokinase [Planctomycetes bacterium]|nr:ribose-phosphate pyrophosphokinase [Planctomycetota bacterium]